jgi:DNA polymerase-1
VPFWFRQFPVAALSPRAVLVGWDTYEAPTYRHEAFPAYQSGRAFDDDVIEQLAVMRGAHRAAGGARPHW